MTTTTTDLMSSYLDVTRPGVGVAFWPATANRH